MKNGFPLTRTLLPVAVAICLAGCATSPTARFYTLSPISPQEAKGSSGAAVNPLSISIAPVEIPDYLDRPQIVTRDGRNELRLAEFDRWAGSLSNNIASVLAENLGLLIGTERVFVYPRMSGEKADYSLALRVLRLECAPGDQVLLKAQWTLLAGPERKDVATRVMTLSEKLNDREYRTMASAISHTLGEVSREIARVIIDLPKDTAAKPPVQVTP
jgi:uncharacterized lipoprotein YmbA